MQMWRQGLRPLSHRSPRLGLVEVDEQLPRFQRSSDATIGMQLQYVSGDRVSKMFGERLWQIWETIGLLKARNSPFAGPSFVTHSSLDHGAVVSLRERRQVLLEFREQVRWTN